LALISHERGDLKNPLSYVMIEIKSIGGNAHEFNNA
jgi:hypothetical protein